MNLTHIIRPIFSSRLRELDRYATQAQQLQLDVLKRLLSKASDTQWGHQHGYNNTLSYQQFAQQTPVNTYEDLKGYIDEMRQGKADLLWPGKVKWYAKAEPPMIRANSSLSVKTDFMTYIMQEEQTVLPGI